MNVHILEVGNKFICGLMRNDERSFIPLDLYRAGSLNPTGGSRFCPICKAGVESNLRGNNHV